MSLYLNLRLSSSTTVFIMFEARTKLNRLSLAPSSLNQKHRVLLLTGRLVAFALCVSGLQSQGCVRLWEF